MTKTKTEKKPAAKEPVAEEKKPETTEMVVIEQPIVQIAESEKVKPWNRSQLDLIKRTIAVGATDDELMMFRWICHRTQLDPFMKQIYFVKRWDSKEGKEKGAIQVGIDGFRVVAERTGSYAGNDDATFEGELELTGPNKDKYIAPEKAMVTVHKIVQGVRVPFTATARWKEYYPGDKQGFMWRTKPHIMLGKVAEALALRKAFPAVLSGLYVEGELDRAATPQTKHDAVEDAFLKAKRMLGGVKDPLVLEDFKKKLTASKLYDKDQKAQLKEVIEKRLKEISKEYDEAAAKEAEAPQGEAI